MNTKRNFKNILVTGGCGFIGSYFVKILSKNNPECNIIILDKMTYAVDSTNVEQIEKLPNTKVIVGSIEDFECVRSIFNKYDIDCVVNFAAESHVDNSIINPIDFINTNILGTRVLLEMCRLKWKANDNKLFVQIGTDEVYGDAEDSMNFTEWSPLRPSSPYSASKASSDCLVMGYGRTFGIPYLITRSCNNYGPFQHKEKLIPKVIINAINHKNIPVYGNGMNYREWIHVADNAMAIYHMIFENEWMPACVVNIGTGNTITNIDLVRYILDIVEKCCFIKDVKSLITFVKDRPGHDFGYRIDSSSLKSFGYTPKSNIKKDMKDVVLFYANNKSN